MDLRIKRVITAAVLCHLLSGGAVLTSRLLAQSAPAPSPHPQDQLRPWDFLQQQSGEPVTIKAREQEKSGSTYTLSGDVEIDFRDIIFRGDQVTYNADTGDLAANGHLILDGGPHDEHVEASHGEYNIRSRSGKFYDVLATTGAQFRGHNVTLTTTTPFVFTGQVVEQAGPDRYIIHHGTVTSCSLPDPKWTFDASDITVDLSGSARIYNSTFRVKRLPVFYFPFAEHSTQALGRQSGFLVPTAGVSSRKGTILGDSFYWAINRSMDATLGAEYFSSRGWAQHIQFRARPTSRSYLNATYFGVLDRGFGPQKIDQGGEDGTLDYTSEFSHNVRAVASLEYLSSFVFRLAFTENFSQAVNSEVKSDAFITQTAPHGIFLNAFASRYQNYESIVRGDLTTIAHAPSLELTMVDQRVASTPIYWSIGAAAEGVTRRDPLFKTDPLVGRFDLHPEATVPLFLRGWTFRPEVGLRDTYYTERKSGPGVGVPVDGPFNRRALDASFELRPPTLGKVFNRTFFGRKLKHTIEPSFTYHLVQGVDDFSQTIRFDSRDILSDTNELEYALTQRLFARRAGDCKKKTCTARDVLTWEVAQRYYLDPNFGGAIFPGVRNVLTSTDQLTGFAFLTEPRRFSPVVSKLRARITDSIDGQWQLDYDTKKGRINGSDVTANFRFGDYFVGGSHVFFHSPGELFVNNVLPAPDRFNQFRTLLGYGGPSKAGWSAATALGFDSNRSFLQYASFQSSYNWDCCGISMEYRRFALGSVRNENSFRFAFTLANIGTFGNIRKRETLF